MNRNAVEFLTTLERRGFRIRLKGGGLEVVPASKLTPEDRSNISFAKSALVPLLTERAQGFRPGWYRSPCGKNGPDPRDSAIREKENSEARPKVNHEGAQRHDGAAWRSMTDRADSAPEVILKNAKTLGVSFRVEGAQLIANPKSKLTPTLTAAIKEHKFGLISLLALTSEEAHKLAVRRPADMKENGSQRNSRGDIDPSPHKAAEQVGSVRSEPGATAAPAGAPPATTADNPDDTGEPAEPAPSDAGTSLTPAQAFESVSVTAAAKDEGLGLDFVTATLETKPLPLGDNFGDRICAPYIIRAARDLGLVICLEVENCVSISGPAEAWGENSRLIRWIEERTALIAEVLAKECRWCAEGGELIDGVFCSEECRDLARPFGWQTDNADTAQGDK